jgi:hypothetical protein
MKNLIAFPLLIFAMMIQTSVVSRLPLLSGTADILLLILAAWALQEQVESAWLWAGLIVLLTAFVSGINPVAPAGGYFFTAALARLIQRRVWQIPSLAMFIVVFAGTLALHVLSFLALQLTGVAVLFSDAFALIIVPSVLINLALALPVYAIIRDLALWVYPVEEMV